MKWECEGFITINTPKLLMCLNSLKIVIYIYISQPVPCNRIEILLRSWTEIGR